MSVLVSQLQSLKDGIVVIEMGADALPFLTTLGTLPASLAYFNFYRCTLVSAQALSGQRWTHAQPCMQGPGVSACFPARVLLL
jgi:hypothetical protein